MTSPTVKQAFSDVDNPFMFQGRPHFAYDTEASATEGVLMLSDHRARDTDVVTGTWTTRDPLHYNGTSQPPAVPAGLGVDANSLETGSVVLESEMLTLY